MRACYGSGRRGDGADGAVAAAGRVARAPGVAGEERGEPRRAVGGQPGGARPPS